MNTDTGDRSAQLVHISRKDNIVTIRLNRPDKLNSLNDQVHAVLRDALDDLQNDQDLRGIILTGTGRAFCAGQDLSDRAPLPEGQKYDLSQSVENNYKPLIMRLKALEVPLICMVNGVAAGAGVSLALASDVVIATQSARFVQGFSRIALIPDAGATYFLPRRIGSARAMGLAMFGDTLSAQQAADWGLIWKVVPDEAFQDEIANIQNWLANAPTQALKRVKTAMQASETNALDQQISLEGVLQGELGRTDDYAEGVAAFANKRAPDFKGK